MHSREDETKLDAIIIGGGPAGSSAALWLKMLGLKSCIIEKRRDLGGLQNESPYPNKWIVTSPKMTGQEVAKTIGENIKTLHAIPYHCDSNVESIEKTENGYKVKFINQQKQSQALFAENVIIASGVSPASGGIPEAKDILIGPGKQIAAYNFTNKKVAILGGGDSAFENYQFMQPKNPASTKIYVRQDGHEIKTRFLYNVPRKDIHLHKGPLKIDSEKLTINGETYDTIVVLYGWTANLSFSYNFKLDLTKKGFIATDPSTRETSVRGVFAIGEVAGRVPPCCVTSMADGASAATEVHRRILFGKNANFFKNKPVDSAPDATFEPSQAKP